MRVSCVRACEGTLEGHRFAAWLLALGGASAFQAPARQIMSELFFTSRPRGNSLFHRSAIYMLPGRFR